MKVLIALFALAAGAAAPVSAQTPHRNATLHIIVHDPSGAVIPNATIDVAGTDPSTHALPVTSATSDGQGVATAANLATGKYSVTVSFPGFESRTLTEVRVRAGDNRRDVTLAIEKVAESVAVGRDPATSASDPKSDRFGNALSKDQIAALPDDPDEMEQALKDIAGPGATIRVDGFRGGKLPPKSQIRSIRFSSGMFAAENHSGGMTFIDIATQPGQGPLRGGVDMSFRDGSLDARNAFQPEKGPEQTQQYGFNLSGSLRKDRTSFSLAGGGASLYDSANVFAALPEGTLGASIRRPSDRMNVNGRLDHALSKSHSLRASVQRNDNDLHELGVGNFDLADRAYTRTSTDGLFRVSESGPWARLWFAESRLQVHWASSDSSSAVETPTVRVLDAFTSGGAQQAGGRRSTEIEYATNVDYAKRGHAIRLGTLVEGGTYRSDSQSNYFGTFTFPSLADFEAGKPATYTRRLGNPLVDYSRWQAGFFVQDDWHVRKNLTVSGGLREELQTRIADHWNLAPRAGFTWSPFKNGKTAVRGGGGVFYDWLDADVYEQTLRVDGIRQQDLVIVNPGYPDTSAGDATLQTLPSSKYMLAPGLPLQKRAIMTAGVSQQLSAMVTLNLNYMHSQGWDRYRGRNVNAPIDGRRPDPALGTVTQIEATSHLRGDTLNAGLNFNLPNRRTFIFANYAWIRQRNDTDGPLGLPADSYNLAAEWGPAGGVPHQIASAIVNTTLPKHVRLAVSATARSGTPYNVTTGRDDNGDTVFTDRPAGIGRNSAMSAGMWDMAARVSYTFGFGQRGQNTGPQGGPLVIMQRPGGGAGDLLNGFGALGGGGAEDKRLRFELFASASNLFNNVNPTGYSGVMTSPFFMQPTAAGPARKIDVGVKIGF
ncbi:MAG TPA: carboxypeptidase regulatory-like domain-containing protein [Vicinamibacterales bacterium]|nr:carboxypeptidase regulatory-like domain-containing protein [Vicinamibacterales bacterium]